VVAVDDRRVVMLRGGLGRDTVCLLEAGETHTVGTDLIESYAVLADEFLVLAGGYGARGFVVVLDLSDRLRREWKCVVHSALLPTAELLRDSQTGVVVGDCGRDAVVTVAPTRTESVVARVSAVRGLAVATPLKPPHWPRWLIVSTVL
jgi:hypothetical protein